MVQHFPPRLHLGQGRAPRHQGNERRHRGQIEHHQEALRSHQQAGNRPEGPRRPHGRKDDHQELLQNEEQQEPGYLEPTDVDRLVDSRPAGLGHFDPLPDHLYRGTRDWKVQGAEV